MTTFTTRAVRSFAIYKSQHPVLTVSDKAGRLYSTAAAAPDARTEHPFVDARAYDPYSEHELGWYLEKSANFEAFIRLLIEAGYDIASLNSTHPEELSAPHRLEDDAGLVGVVWSTGGQFTTLEHQPEADAAVFAHATLTAYREAAAESLLHALEKTTSFAALRQALERDGLHLTPLEKYTV